MGRLASIGLCAAALFALAATNASASVPTWYHCDTAAKSAAGYTGHYTGKFCEAATKVATGGKFELTEGIGAGKEFKGKGATTVLHVKTWLGDDTIQCASSKVSGTPELPNLETKVAVTYKGCKALGGKRCSSAGALAGEVKIAGLKGELGYIEESPTPVVGVKLESQARPGPDGELVSFNCQGLEVTVTGGLIGRQAKDVDVVNKESEAVYLAGEYIGEREHEGQKYAPLVNIVGWAGEQEAIANEIKADEHGEIAKMARAVLKALMCEPSAACLPEAYAGQDQTTIDKGEALMIKTTFGAGEATKSLLIGEKLEHSIAGDSKTEEITPLKFTAAKSGTVEEIFYETGGYAPSAEEKWAKSLVLAIQEDAGGGRPGKILAEGTRTGTLGINKVVSVGGLKAPVVKGKTYWLTFLPLGGSITYWYENNETVIFSVGHKSLVEGPPESWTWTEEPDVDGKPAGAPIGLWAKGS
jgi:hypothetical protein